MKKYGQIVAEGIGQETIWKDLNRHIFLGDDRFVTRMQKKVQNRSEYVNVPKVQRRPPAPSLQAIADTYERRNDAIAAAYSTGEYSFQQIEDFFGLYFTTVGKIVRAVRVRDKR